LPGLHIPRGQRGGKGALKSTGCGSNDVINRRGVRLFHC
jgi:hypothetical protein